MIENIQDKLLEKKQAKNAKLRAKLDGSWRKVLQNFLQGT